MTPHNYKIGDFVGYVEREAAIDITATQDGLWYLVQTEPGREMTAQANLVLRKVPFYMPTMLKAARISSQAHRAGEAHPDIVRPLFPGLLFINENVIDRCHRTICATPGMSARPFWIVDGQPAVMRPRDMQIIRYIEAGERELYQRRKPTTGLYQPEIGDDVRILLSEMTGSLKGRVSEIDDRGRITLLVNIMKRQVRVHATSDQINPV